MPTRGKYKTQHLPCRTSGTTIAHTKYWQLSGPIRPVASFWCQSLKRIYCVVCTRVAYDIMLPKIEQRIRNPIEIHNIIIFGRYNCCINWPFSLTIMFYEDKFKYFYGRTTFHTNNLPLALLWVRRGSVLSNWVELVFIIFPFISLRQWHYISLDLLFFYTRLLVKADVSSR